MAKATIAVIVCRMPDSPFPSMTEPRPFYAYVAANPQLRADGRNEEEALRHLETVILDCSKKAVSRKVVELRFDELIVEEVMQG